MKENIIGGMSCDTETGICEIPRDFTDNKQGIVNKPVRLLYFTDPICSSCWGIEPQLRKLKQEYGEYFHVEYRMGGLLKSWSDYGGNDVSGPGSVAQHWEEASAYYQMPIDGEVWNEDPLHSSFPPAIAFKAAQLQGNYNAERFLRRIKEMVFIEKVNISKMDNPVKAAENVGLDIVQFQSDVEDGAKQLFEEDLLMTREWGVRGFPTINFIDEEDNRFKVYGSKPYHVYEQALLKLVTGPVHRNTASSYEIIFTQYNTVTLKEFAVFYEVDFEKAENILHELEQQKVVKRMVTNAGSLWKVNN
jgi:predicted DsbA family dithiol-disulfide isomerase